MTNEPARKRLVRSSDDAWLGGICGGLADYSGVDANLIRLGAVVLTILGFGTTVVIYAVAWLLMPKQ